MILQGVLDRSFGNFICLRGYAPLGKLYRISEAESSYQRDLITDHQKDMETFLDDGEFLFYPEIILGTGLDDDKGTKAIEVDELHYQFGISDDTYRQSFSQFSLRYYVHKLKSNINYTNYYRARINIRESKIESNSFNRFHRIDGNHRISVLDKNNKYKNLKVPFCIILFRNPDELKRHSPALFHNINYKQIPLTMEQSLKEILGQRNEEKNLFDDDVLTEKFGKNYLLARKVLSSWDSAMIPNIDNVIKYVSKKKPEMKRTFLLKTFQYLTDNKLVSRSKSKVNAEVTKFKGKLGEINAIYEHPSLGKKRNSGLLSAFFYYSYKSPTKLTVFKNWVLENHIYQTEDTNAKEIIKIFDCVLDAKKRTIFVSMQFSPETKENFQAIKDAVGEINKSHDDFDLELRQIRIDQFNKGYSYKIDDEILEQILSCGLMLADISLGNKNVYHEIGYLMGLNKNSSESQDNFILFHNEKTKGASFHDDLGFNLKPLKVLAAKDSNDLRKQIQAQVEKHYNL